MLSFSSGYLAFTRETTHIVAMFVRDGGLLGAQTWRGWVEVISWFCIQRAAHTRQPMEKLTDGEAKKKIIKDKEKNKERDRPYMTDGVPSATPTKICFLRSLIASLSHQSHFFHHTCFHISQISSFLKSELLVNWFLLLWAVTIQTKTTWDTKQTKARFNFFNLNVKINWNIKDFKTPLFW